MSFAAGAAQMGASVVLVERGKMGGDCLNTGCVPSKALIRSAKLLNQISRSAHYGIATASATFDFAEVMARIKNVIKTIEPHDSAERYEALGVECVKGHATLESPFEVRVGERVITLKLSFLFFRVRFPFS